LSCWFRLRDTPLTLAKRCMWVYALPDSTRLLCLTTKVFSPKRRKYAYSGLHILHISPLCALDSTGVCYCWEIPFFSEKILFKRDIILREKYFWKKKYFYFSKEKSPVLSQVGRSPTCIGADKGQLVVITQKMLATDHYINFRKWMKAYRGYRYSLLEGVSTLYWTLAGVQLLAYMSSMSSCWRWVAHYSYVPRWRM